MWWSDQGEGVIFSGGILLHLFQCSILIITLNHCVHRMKSFQPKHKQELFAAIFWRWVFMSQDNECRSKYSLWDKVLVIVFSSFFQVSTDVCFIKIDFHEFLLESGNKDSCWFNFYYNLSSVNLYLVSWKTILEFLFCEKGPDGSCQNNWFSVIGANGGMQVVPSMCGERRGQSSNI